MVLYFKIYEAGVIGTHPNNKEFVCKNKDYNKIVYYYKDKVMNMYLQGSQYLTDDRSSKNSTWVYSDQSLNKRMCSQITLKLPFASSVRTLLSVPRE